MLKARNVSCESVLSPLCRGDKSELKIEDLHLYYKLVDPNPKVYQNGKHWLLHTRT
jgi:hypothetical protein